MQSFAFKKDFALLKMHNPKYIYCAGFVNAVSCYALHNFSGLLKYLLLQHSKQFKQLFAIILVGQKIITDHVKWNWSTYDFVDLHCWLVEILIK